MTCVPSDFLAFFSNGKQKFGGAIKAKWFLGLWKFMTAVQAAETACRIGTVGAVYL